MKIHTSNFGELQVEEGSVIEFPQGLPAFEDCCRFVPLEHPEYQGLVFLQSLDRPGLCFMTLPVLALRPDYELQIAAEDLDLLGLAEDRQPRIGPEVAAMAIVSVVEGEEPTANLLSPLVVRVDNNRAVQAIRQDSRYGCRERLAVAEEVCS